MALHQLGLKAQATETAVLRDDVVLSGHGEAVAEAQRWGHAMGTGPWSNLQSSHDCGPHGLEQQQHRQRTACSHFLG